MYFTDADMQEMHVLLKDKEISWQAMKEVI